MTCLLSTRKPAKEDWPKTSTEQLLPVQGAVSLSHQLSVSCLTTHVSTVRQGLKMNKFNGICFAYSVSFFYFCDIIRWRYVHLYVDCEDK